MLLIVTDDQRAGSGTMRVMPKTRHWFGDNGTRYSRAFSTTPLCCPARASILTGRYAHNHGIWTNIGKPNFDHKHTVEAYLHRAGYLTAMTGKFFNDWPLKQRPPFFDRWSLFQGGYYGYPFNVDGDIRDIGRYSTDYISDRAVHYLETFNSQHDEQPWFLYVTPYAPHAPFTPARKYEDVKVPGWPGNPATKEKDRSDKPRYVRQRHETYGTWRKNRRLQLRALKSVDDLVSRIAGKLRGLDETNRTLAFVFSDNGYMWADHGLFDKGAPYTPSIEIPMLARWPGHLQEGVTDHRLVGNIDIAPTVLEAAAITPSPSMPMDGHSLLDESWSRPRILTEYRNHDNAFTPPTWASLRTRHIQYTEYYEGDDVIFREFYKLRRDPWQLQNLLHDGNGKNNPPPKRLKALSKRLAHDRTCTGQSCP